MKGMVYETVTAVVLVSLLAFYGISVAQQELGPQTTYDADLVTGDEIVTLRHWRILKGSFPEFLAASREGVWPYFEKIGARVVGMWRVLPVELQSRAGGFDNNGYTVLEDNDENFDEVWLMTRYASMDQWQATRSPARLGGSGADYEALIEALAIRQSLTIDTDLTFLSGYTGPNPPRYQPQHTESAN